jgi:hypothetical protein
MADMTAGARRASIALLLLVLLVGAGNLWASFDLTRGLQRTDTGQQALCQATNASRTQQIQLWDYLLALPPAPGAAKRTAAQDRQIAAFRIYIGKVFAVRDCSRLAS